MMFEVDNRVKLYLARVLYESGRFDDASSMMKTLIDAKYNFSEDDFHLVVSIWQAMISPIRIGIMNMKDDISTYPKMKLAIDSLIRELRTKIDEIIGFTKAFILPSLESDESKSIFYKHYADFLRYSLPTLTADEIMNAAMESKSFYEKALDVIRVMTKPHFDLKLSIILNHSILLADYLSQKQKAVDTITELKKETKQSFEKYPDEIKPRISTILELMDDNLKRWNDH